MSLDKGVRDQAVSVKSDRSGEYVNALKKEQSDLIASIRSLKEENDVLKNEQIKTINKHDADIKDKESILSELISKISVAKKNLQIVTEESLNILASVNDERSKLERRRVDVEEDLRNKVAYAKNQIALMEKRIRDLEREELAIAVNIDVLKREEEYQKMLNRNIFEVNQSLEKRKIDINNEILDADSKVNQIQKSISEKQKEVSDLQNYKESLAIEKTALEVEVDNLKVEKEKIAAMREANTKRAAELAQMAQDLKLESMALANKNAFLARKEALLKEAQTKI